MVQKIWTAKQIKKWDEYTILNEPISSILLMERAASKASEFILKNFTHEHFYIFCGQGNNGGDGLAIARMLSEKGKMCSVFIIQTKETGSPNFETNLVALKKHPSVVILEIKSGNEIPVLNDNALIIDALLGTGLNGSVDGLLKETILHINTLHQPTISIDVSSGLLCDEALLPYSTVIQAYTTLSFQCVKMAFLFAENYKYTGEVKILDIGLSAEFTKTEKSNYTLIDGTLISSLIKKRLVFAHKGNFGHALILAGSKGKIGAALLASKACLKSGCGLLTLHSIDSAAQALHSYLPSAMFSFDNSNEYISQIPEIANYNAIAIGPGIGQAEQTVQQLKLLIQQTKVPLLLDADAINILSENKTWLSFLPNNSILTPHFKEFERLVGKWNNSFERVEIQKNFSVKHQCYVIFKGAYTCISTPQGNCYFNTSGNSGMAKGGSGDVLTGIITGLLAQGYTPLNASVIGVFIHGLSGDLAKEAQGEISMLPEDLINELGTAFKAFQNKTNLQ